MSPSYSPTSANRMSKASRAIAVFLCAGLLPLSGAESPSFGDLVSGISWQSADLVESIKRMRLREDLNASGQSIGQSLRQAGIPMYLDETSAPQDGASPRIRVGVKHLVLDGIEWGHHYSDSEQKKWVDIVRFSDVDSARAVFQHSRQWHSGIYAQDHFAFFTTSMEEPNGISILVLKDEYLVNIGQDLPFVLSYEEENPPEQAQEASAAIDEVLTATEALARSIVAPDFVGYIPKAHPTDTEIRDLRMAGFAKMWSAVKQNFVFLDQRPNVDWEGILPSYLPRVARAKSHAEYLGLVEEALALLEDGHTRLLGTIGLNDIPALRIESVEGRPVVTEVGDTPELVQAGIAVGAEIIEVDGVPFENLLQQRLRRISASTPHDRRDRAYRSLLQGPVGGTATVTLREPNREPRTIRLNRNLQENRLAAPWLSRPRLEYRELEDGISYVALNSFGSDRIVEEFDEHFDRIAASRALILDIRENGGGSTGNGFAIIARLIEDQITETSTWRTRLYRPTLEAWGRPSEWHEGGDSGVIEPRGSSAFTGPVAVLVGPRTFSSAEDFLVPLKATKRAVLVGSVTGGSTGQPIRVPIYQASVLICTKWDRFPDGTEFVGVGVRPDIPVERTIEDVARGIDPVLQAAIVAMNDRPER